MKRQGIGVFDSGVGGLTVLKKMIEVLPHEDMIYLGDTDRVPYGTRGEEEVKEFALEIVDFLKEKEVKAMVIACNTITSIAMDEIKSRLDIPVIGVIEPGVNKALGMSRNKKVGVIGTDGTVNSRSYDKTFLSKSEDIEVRGVACPSFVEMVETGKLDSDKIRAVGGEYFKGFQDFDLDTLILGCTHFPVIEGQIRELLDEGVNIIDPAMETAKLTRRILGELDLLNPQKEAGRKKFFITGDKEQFKNIGEKVLESEIKDLEKIEL